ncbi:hydantoinase B/oxoprolinase family protein [Rhodococcus koreensis]
MTTATFDPVLTAVLSNRVDSIVREMTNSLLRSARSAVINSARDFSCAITTADNQLLAAAEGLPVHIFGAHLQTAAMAAAHPNLREGDAFLDNDPYVGNSHAADHTVLVPVFVDGEHLFTTVAKAHQADIGNSIPTTYHASAKDVYEEGALIFPVVQVQRDYENIDDIVRMCRSRIRVPSQWYGDFLAALGAARIAERRLKELCTKYGADTIKNFVVNWLDYSEQRMAKAIEKMPAASLHNTGRHDAFAPYLPDGLPFTVALEIHPDRGTIEVDLTDNIDNVDCGLNMTEATTKAAVFAGIFNCIDKGIPKNSGSFRRVDIALREGAAVGKPKFPHSCSVATTNLTDRVVNCVQSAFAHLGEPYGLAEGAVGVGVGEAVVSGTDRRHGGEAFVNQIVVSANGGPGGPTADGWVTYGLPVVSGLMYRDSVEVDEIKMPFQYQHMRLISGSGGAGKYRGAPGLDIAFGPKFDPITVIYPCDGQDTPPRGVLGGHDGSRAAGWRVHANGTREQLPNNTVVELQPGELIRGVDASGGGYGDPADRDPQRVLHDVVEGWESAERARTLYKVVLTDGRVGLQVDTDATTALRAIGIEGSRA